MKYLPDSYFVNITDGPYAGDYNLDLFGCRICGFDTDLEILIDEHLMNHHGLYSNGSDTDGPIWEQRIRVVH